MDELKRDLEATRTGLTEVRKELRERPTRRQFNAVVVAAVLVVIGVCVGAYFAIQGATDSGGAKAAAQAAADTGKDVSRGFLVQGCRADLRASIVDSADQELQAAIQERASAIQKRDNLTIEALQYLALDDLEGIERVALQAPAARDLVAWTDAIVQQKVDASEAAQAEYEASVSRSIKDPDGFVEECSTRGN